MERMRGVARYTDDLKLPGMLHAKILRSPHAHARIRGIDLAPALALPGVFAAVTGQDFKIPYGIIPWTPDENALAVDKVCHVGDGVVAIAAIDEDTANAACKAVIVDYEPLRAFFDPEEALAVRDREGTINPYSRKGNVSKHVLLEFGEVDAELAASDLVIEGDYEFGGTTHGAIEPHCAVALVEPSGILTVWSATQVSHYLHRELAKVLELPPHRIRVIQPPLGGAFGGKSEPFDLEFCVAKLAMKTGRPVKCLYTREEVFYAHRGRHPMKMRHRTGFTREGKIKAVDAQTILDGGAYSSFGLVTTYYSGQLLCCALRVPGLPLPQHAGLHQQAGLRTQARPWLGPASLRDRGPARQGRAGARPRSLRAAPTQRHGPRQRDHQRVSRSAATASSSAWRGSRRPRAGASGGRSWATGAGSGSRGAPTSAGPTTRSTPTTCRRRPCRSPSIAAVARACSRAPTTSARAATRCWR